MDEFVADLAVFFVQACEPGFAGCGCSGIQSDVAVGDRGEWLWERLRCKLGLWLRQLVSFLLAIFTVTARRP